MANSKDSGNLESFRFFLNTHIRIIFQINIVANYFYKFPEFPSLNLQEIKHQVFNPLDFRLETILRNFFIVNQLLDGFDQL